MTMDAFETTVPLSLADTDRADRDRCRRDTESEARCREAATGDARRMQPGLCEPDARARPVGGAGVPCNVTLESADGGTRVRVIDPRVLIDDPRFASLAEEAAGKLRAAFSLLSPRACA
jgi:hypothetical protein